MQRISITNPQNIIDGTAKKYYFKLRNTGGPKGDKGDKGDTGSRGPQGEPGNAATVYVGSTTTLPVGQDATVENVGTQYNAVLNFGIPQGPRGPQGVKGDPGEPGQKGDPGPRGVQGERGTNATVYIGTTSTLNPGSQATVYNSGTDSNAVLNFGIPRGEKGETGATGATGATGPAGQNFTPTIVDSLPATGNQSNLYLTPKNYTTGTATGNPITISIGEDAGQVTSAQLDGNTTQQTYSGKNLMDTYSFVGKNAVGTLTVSEDGVLALTGNTNSNGWCGINKDGTTLKDLAPSLVAGNTYYLYFQGENLARTHIYLNGSATQWSHGQAHTITQAELDNFVVIYGGYNTTTKIKIMVTTALDDTYEKYVGGTASPNPDYPQAVNTVTGTQTVKVYSKNLLSLNPNTDNGLTGNIQDDSIVTITGKATNTSAKIATASASIPAGTYTFSIDRPSANVTNLIIGTNNGTVSFRIAAGQTSATATLTASGYDYSLWVGAVSGTTYNDTYKLQLELGSTATAFTKYNKQTLPLDLGSIELCKLGTYQDYIYKDGDSWKVHKAIGSMNLANGEYVATTSSIRGLTNAPNIKYVSANTEVGVAATNGYILRQGRGLGELYGYFAVDVNRVNFNTGSYTNPVGILYYALATATDTTITDQTLIAQLEDVRNATLQASNTITNTAAGTNLAGDLELGYYEYDPHNRYNKWLWLDINNNYEQLGS